VGKKERRKSAKQKNHREKKPAPVKKDTEKGNQEWPFKQGEGGGMKSLGVTGKSLGPK